MRGGECHHTGEVGVFRPFSPEQVVERFKRVVEGVGSGGLIIWTVWFTGGEECQKALCDEEARNIILLFSF